jgi:membrane associated rhomboid family serine protease
MFLHSSWAHLLSNMLYLGVFGAPSSDARGPSAFFAFYGFCGLIASIAHVLSDSESMVPMVGASGAISGILGAIRAHLPAQRGAGDHSPAHHRPDPTLAAAVVFGFWLLEQWTEYLRAEPGAAGGVAFMAHIGGFLTRADPGRLPHPQPSAAQAKRHGWGLLTDPRVDTAERRVLQLLR